MPRSKPPAWTADELATLAEVFPRAGVNAASDALPGRSWHAINVMASKLSLRSPVKGDAPKPRLQGIELEEAIRLREEAGYSFARIGATFGVSESSACNAVLIALCPRKGFTPAQRDEHGSLTSDGLERVRLMLRKGVKGVDIQLRLGVSASCVAEQRRRYRCDLKARGKAALPPPGAGDAYSGVKLSVGKKREVEALLLEGFGAKKVSERTGVSNTSVGRIRNRLIKRLGRKGETLPGCDRRGRRGGAKESLHYIPAAAVAELRARLLARQPVTRAARDLGIGGSAAYRIRDTLAAELATRGDALLPPMRLGRREARIEAQRSSWLPANKLQRFRELTHAHGLDQAKAMVLEELATEQRARAGAEAARLAGMSSLDRQLERLRAGATLVRRLDLRRPDPTMTLGGVATGAL